MHAGVLYAALAYTAWGLFPIFFKQLAAVNAFEVVMHRTVWSLVFLLGVLAVRRHWAWLGTALRTPRVLGAFVLSALLLPPQISALRDRQTLGTIHTALLAQEELDGRFGGNEEAKKGADGARRYYVGLNSTTPQKQQEWMARQAYISLGFLLMGAATLGLDATPIEGFFPEKLDAALGLVLWGSLAYQQGLYRTAQDSRLALN